MSQEQNQRPCKLLQTCFITQSHLLAKVQLSAIINMCALNLWIWAGMQNWIITEQLPVLIQLSKPLLLHSGLSFLNYTANNFGKNHLTLLPTRWFPHWTKWLEKWFLKRNWETDFPSPTYIHIHILLPTVRVESNEAEPTKLPYCQCLFSTVPSITRLECRGDQCKLFNSISVAGIP